MKTIFKRLAALLLAVWLLAIPALAVPEDGRGQLDLLEEIIEYIEMYHLYPSGDRSLNGITAYELEKDPQLFYKLVASWLANDKYGYFMSGDERNAAYNISGGGSAGIGVKIDVSMPMGIYVDSFLPGGEAGDSGMELGAQIVYADGVDIADMHYLRAREYLVGDSYTSVEVGYLNPGSDEIVYETLMRRQLNVYNVNAQIIEGTSIGYISIEQFGSIADFLDFDEAYNGYLPAMGASSVIIDLRGNPGGELFTVVNMLNVMLKDEGYLLCELVGKTEEENEMIVSTGWTDEELEAYGAIVWEPETIVVLVNGGSASASEVFSGTLQGYGLAAIVGETTYGKAHSQYHIELSSGDYLIITSSSIELYELGAYEGVGIIPDYGVEQKITTGAEMNLLPLNSSRSIFRQSAATGRILAMQERLALLGYYRTEPSGVFDGYTLWALNRFQAANGLTKAAFANAATLRELERLADEAEFAEDRQLEFAVGLCE